MAPELSDGQAPVRVLLAVGNPERERRVRDAISGDGMVIADRCLDAVSLVERAAAMDLDVALASSDLHRLTGASLTAIREARLPLVLLVEPADIERYAGLAHLVPAAAANEEVCGALREARARGPAYPTPAGTDAPDQTPDGGEGDGDDGGREGQVIAVVSGKGAPGKTTVAIGLAVALANAGLRAVLVDADLRGGNVGSYLDLDPRVGLVGLAFGGNGASEHSRIEEELQEGPGFAVLAGLERAETSSTVSAELLAGTVRSLRGLFDSVVLDAGEAIPGMQRSATDSLLRLADRVLLVTCGDLVSLWNARAAVRHLREGLGVAAEAIAVVLNQKEGRGRYGAAEVERALGVSVLAAVGEDRRAARRAIEAQLPITAVGGRAARELRRLADRLTEEPAATAAPTPRRRWRLPFSRTAIGTR